MEISNTVQSLELRTNNPYSLGEILTVNTESMLEPPVINYQKSFLDRHYTVTEKDTLGTIAYEAWEDSKLWWILWFVNLAAIDNPFELTPGMDLLVPDLDTFYLQNL